MRADTVDWTTITPHKQLANELQKPIIKKFQNDKVYSSLVDNIWAADLAAMHLVSKYNKRIRVLLFVINTFSKYVWFMSLKDKRLKQLLKHLKTLQKINHKSNKIEVEKGNEFYKNPWNHGCKIRILKFIPQMMKENQWLLNDSLDL